MATNLTSQTVFENFASQPGKLVELRVAQKVIFTNDEGAWSFWGQTAFAVTNSNEAYKAISFSYSSKYDGLRLNDTADLEEAVLLKGAFMNMLQRAGTLPSGTTIQFVLKNGLHSKFDGTNVLFERSFPRVFFAQKTNALEKITKSLDDAIANIPKP